MNRMCIYKIHNKVNDFIYVGSTKALDLRKWYHLDKLTKRKHSNYKLQRDFNKGIELLFDVIEVVNDVEDLVSREQHWMDLLKPKYNILKIAERGSSVDYKKYKRKTFRENKRKNHIAELNTKLNDYSVVHPKIENKRRRYS